MKPSAAPPRMTWVVSELYRPEETSTGHYMTRLAEFLAASRPVSVLCAQPNYASKGIRAPRRERFRGVDIFRCPSTGFDKNRVVLRLLNMVAFSLSAALKAAAGIRRGDVVLVVTNPPLLPLLMVFLCRAKGARCFVRIDDLYPHLLVAMRAVGERQPLYRLMHRFAIGAYNRAFRIVVVGRDVASRLKGDPGFREPGRIRLIPHWADESEVRPSPKRENPLLRRLGIEDKFVVLYAGNMGYPHDLATLEAVIGRLADDGGIRFLFIGSGSKKEGLERRLRDKGYANALILGQKPRSEQNEFLNACDLAVSSLVRGLAGISVPSRAFNVFAAGKPLLVIGDSGSELSRVVEEEGVGWSAEPGQVDKIVSLISSARNDGEMLKAMGDKARALAEGKYSSGKILSAYRELLDEKP